VVKQMKKRKSGYYWVQKADHIFPGAGDFIIVYYNGKDWLAGHSTYYEASYFQWISSKPISPPKNKN